MSQIDNVKEFGQKVTDDYTSLRSDIAKLSETVAALVSKQADVATARVSEAVDTARDVLTDQAGKAQDKMKSAGAELEASIERNPYSAVLIALGIGVALGLLNRSR